MKHKAHKRITWEAAKPDGTAAPFAMCFTEEALAELLATVGARAPETGAKGFCPYNAIGFDVVEFDTAGSEAAGGAVYRPDAKWGSERQQFHLNQPEEQMRLWSGDLHSHPGDVGRPSSKAGPGLGDLGYVEAVFDMNPSMEWFFLPILTGAGTASVVIHPWAIRRGHDGRPPTVHVAAFRVCPVAEFPAREFNPEWEAASGAGKEASAAGTASAPPTRPETAALIGRYTRRLEGIVSPAFRTRTVALVGVGAGSYLAEKLARLCPARLKLCDPDRVELENLSRTVYTVADAESGLYKVDALASRIRAVNPLVQVDAVPRKLDDLTCRERRDFLHGADLLIAGTDDFACQALCNELSVLLSVPAVFVGIHQGAQGGRIVWHVPDATPCYRCVAHERFVAALDSGAQRVNLPGAAGSLIDAQFIDMIAGKVAVGILERGQPSAAGRFFEHMKNRNDIVCRCDPVYEWGGAIWDAVLGDLPRTPKDFAQELKRTAILAMDTVWLTGEAMPGCPVCGRHASTGG